MKNVRTLMLALCAALLTVGLMPRALADTKADMIAIMDKISENKAGAEAVIDWDNLAVISPQTQGMDLKKMYAGMDAANKKAFRTSFLKSFAASFKQSAGGHKFSEAAKVKGAVTVSDKGNKPTLTLHPKGSKSDVKLGFVRKSGKLLLQRIEAG